jgi:hypothetical protein
MTLFFKWFTEVNPADIMGLMNNQQIRKEMPLTKDNFNKTGAKAFVLGKEQLCKEHGFGPWAFFIDRPFAGWGGVQPSRTRGRGLKRLGFVQDGEVMLGEEQFIRYRLCVPRASNVL